jgi:hypothetical protein
MLFAKEKVQVRIQAGIPLHPAVIPVRARKVANILAQHFDRRGAIPLRLRIENEFGSARRMRGGLPRGHLRCRWPGLVRPGHLSAGPAAKEDGEKPNAGQAPPPLAWPGAAAAC